MWAPAVLFALAAGQVDWELALDNRFFAARTSTTSDEVFAYQLHVIGRAAVRPLDEVGLELGLDTGLLQFGSGGAIIDGRNASDALAKTGFLGETKIDLQLGPGGFVQLQAGKLRPRIGRGAIFDAYALGISIDVDATLLDEERPWSGRLSAFLPDASFTGSGKRSPLFDLQVAYHFTLRTHVRAIAAAMVLNDDFELPTLASALTRPRPGQISVAAEAAIAALPQNQRNAARQDVDALQRSAAMRFDSNQLGYDVSKTGLLGWSGLATEMGFGDLEIGAALLFGWGRVSAEVAPDGRLTRHVREHLGRFPEIAETILASQGSAQKLSLTSFFLGVDARYFLTRDLSFDLFGIAMSGEGTISGEDTDRTYDAFLAVAPFLPKTMIFFNGGVARHLSTPVTDSVALDGAGLFAGGIQASWFVLDFLRVRAHLAAMASSLTRDAYGVELDLGTDLYATDWFAATVEGAIFFPDEQLADAAPAYQVILSVRQWFAGRER